MLKTVYAVMDNTTGMLCSSRCRGIRYYERKGDARNLKNKMCKHGRNPEDLSIIGYMLMAVEIDGKAVKV